VVADVAAEAFETLDGAFWRTPGQHLEDDDARDGQPREREHPCATLTASKVRPQNGRPGGDHHRPRVHGTAGELVMLNLMVMYVIIVFTVYLDIFRSDDLSGRKKAIWVLALLFSPIFSLVIYLGCRSARSVVLMFDGVEERLYVVVFASDEPDDQLFVIALLVFVAPGQHALHAVAVDGDVFIAVVTHGRDNGQLDLRIWWLVLQHVDQFTHSHCGAFRVSRSRTSRRRASD